MLVARTAAWAAIGLSAIGLIMAANYGDPFIGAAALSVLFVAALFWSLAEIGDRLGEPASGTAAQEAPTPLEDGGPPEVTGPVSTLEDLERKLAAAKAR